MTPGTVLAFLAGRNGTFPPDLTITVKETFGDPVRWVTFDHGNAEQFILADRLDFEREE